MRSGRRWHQGGRALAGIVEFVREHCTGSTIVAVDAPLVVTNVIGFRECERELGRRFGRFHASCHSNNLTRTPQPAGVRLVEALTAYGFRHDFNIATALKRSGRWLFEIYPHPAMVVLFSLKRIIPQKKGTVAQNRRGFQVLQRHLGSLTAPSFGLVSNRPLEAVLAQNVAALARQALKRYEDTLHALFCTYLAWHCWRWGEARNEMFGTLENGYVVVPKAAG